jgi:coenzyme F420-reducing hydrogenase gamma subunit
MKKAKVGWFSFTCCEDSTIVFTELMNTHYDEWKKIIDIKAARILRKKEDLRDLDISFVEGAIASERDAEKLRKIRENSKILVAIGACACEGMPSSQRNKFDEKQKKEIRDEVKMFDLLKETLPINKFVKVDEYVEGCPMSEQAFLNVLDKCVKKVR